MEVVAGDLLDAESLLSALAGVAVAYYLVHSMGSAGNFEEQDRRAAQNFAAAAKAAGVERIIYLGGLGEDAAISRLICAVGTRSVKSSVPRACR